MARAGGRGSSALVYGLLLVNFVLYIVQDAQSAAHTIPADASLLDWTRAYATSIDLLAWFVLIAFFELETGARIDWARRRTLQWMVRGVRLLCIVAIVHTTYADTVFLAQYYAAERRPDAADVCAYSDGEWSFLRNRGYTVIDDANCGALAQDATRYVIGGDPVVTDAAGLREHRILAWTDLVENLSWLLIVLISELVVRSHARIAGARILDAANGVKFFLYALIVCIALYWGSKAQILYCYDELLWVLGFLGIEGNLTRRREQITATRTGEPPVLAPSPAARG